MAEIISGKLVSAEVRKNIARIQTVLSEQAKAN